MAGQSDSSSFPLREGGSIPRELVAAHARELERVYAAPLETLAACGGISVFELLVLLPDPDCPDPVAHRRKVWGLTLNQAMKLKAEKLTAFHKQREADAEAAMLAMMEAEAEAEAAGEPVP